MRAEPVVQSDGFAPWVVGVYPLQKPPQIIALLETVIASETAEDPRSGQRWLRRDRRQWSPDFPQLGVTVSHVTVRRWLKQPK